MTSLTLYTKNQEINMAKTFAEAVVATKPPLIAPPSASSFDADRVKQILENKGVDFNAPDGTTIGAGDELFDSFNKAQKFEIQKIMSKLGYKSQGINELKTLLAAWYPTIYDSATNFAQLYTSLASDLLVSDKEALPQRAIGSYDPTAIKSWIDNIYVSTLGRAATKEELDVRFEEVKPLLEAGTLTTSKKEFNKDTNQTELVIRTDKSFDQPAVEQTIEEKLKLLNPNDYDRQQRIGFADWLSKNVAGA
jgi:hypothetical protein